MTDTPPDIQTLHRRLLLARRGEERLRMAVSMGRTARALVWASLPAELSEPDRREQFFLRFYGADFSPERRAEIGSHVRRTAAAPQRVFGVAEPTRSGVRHLP